MKTVLLILDGLADGLSALAGAHTPLAAAHTPNLDRLAMLGTVGRVQPTPPGFLPGSETGILSIMGARPVPFGRAAVEAAGRGLSVPAGMMALRATTVRLSGPVDDPDTVLQEVVHGPESVRVATAAQAHLLQNVLYPDSAGRHIMLTRQSADVATPAPHGMVGLPVALAGELPGLLQATLTDGLFLWPWGNGPALLPQAVPFGAMIAGVDLVRGIGQTFGMETPEVAGATGETDTDLTAKFYAAKMALTRHNSVVVHVEGPDMAAHRRAPNEKKQMIERIDTELVQPLAAMDDLRLVVTCDHATSSASGRHLPAPVPYLFSDSVAPGTASGRFSEAGVASCPVLDVRAWRSALEGATVPC